MRVTVLHEAWRPHPLAWIHRAEARGIAGELRRAGHTVRLARYGGILPPSAGSALLMRLSDPVMLGAARTLTDASIAYLGPGAAAMERCYDKLAATRIAEENGLDCPATALPGDAAITPPLVVKPRRGSDSIGVRVLRNGAVAGNARGEDCIVQEHVHGTELTVGVIDGRAGMPLCIFLPEGTPYSFLRKYVVRPRSAPLEDGDLAGRARDVASRIADLLGVDWAVRVDLIHETATGRLCFLECDAAPLVGERSAFAASLAAAGISRDEQLRALLREP